MATEAVLSVDRRRRNRAIARLIRLDRARRQDVQLQLQREREAVAALVQRHYLKRLPSFIVLDYRFWQLRRAGWDILKPPYLNGVDPHNNKVWLWWTGLHYTVRRKLVRLAPRRRKA